LLLQAVVQDMALKWKKAHGDKENLAEHDSLPASDVEMGEGPLLTPNSQKSTAAFVLAQAK
jgi:hypothetical protein